MHLRSNHGKRLLTDGVRASGSEVMGYEEACFRLAPPVGSLKARDSKPSSSQLLWGYYSTPIFICQEVFCKKMCFFCKNHPLLHIFYSLTPPHSFFFIDKTGTNCAKTGENRGEYLTFLWNHVILNSEKFGMISA